MAWERGRLARHGAPGKEGVRLGARAFVGPQVSRNGF